MVDDHPYTSAEMKMANPVSVLKVTAKNFDEESDKELEKNIKSVMDE